jgi:hypothetical protein
MTNVLPVLFSGFIAFVDGQPASAYVLESTMHKTYLVFQAPENPETYPRGVDCEKLQGWVYCFIEKGANVDLFFDPPTSRSNKTIPNRPNVVRPLNTDGAEDPAWLLRIANVDRTRRRVKRFSDISRYVRLKMEFYWQEAKTCHLDQYKEDGEIDYRIYPERFVESISGASGYAQALAESVMFTLEFPGDSVRLHLQERGQADEVYFTLKCDDGKCSGLYVSSDGMDECEQDIGAHFKGYYNIAVEEDDKKKKRIPIRVREGTVPLSVGEDQLNSCSEDYVTLRAARKRGKDADTEGVETRVICPMVMFDK